MDQNQWKDLERMADVDGAPTASLLTPDVRSGASFTFPNSQSTDRASMYMVVWVYDIAREGLADFVKKLQDCEPTMPAFTNVTYRGTYAVTISNAVQDAQYRTYWGLNTLAALEELNTHLATHNGLKELIALIPGKDMRTEIMGLARFAKAFGT